MTFALLIAIPVILAGVIFALYRSRLPNWLKVVFIAVLTIPLIGSVVAIVGIFSHG